MIVCAIKYGGKELGENSRMIGHEEAVVGHYTPARSRRGVKSAELRFKYDYKY